MYLAKDKKGNKTFANITVFTYKKLLLLINNPTCGHLNEIFLKDMFNYNTLYAYAML